MNKKIGIIIGSLRKESFSKKLGQEIIKMSPEGYDFNIVSIDDLPLYNQDFDDFGKAPESYKRFRNEVKNLDGFIFITPEYNRSVPAVLKNALDVGSRPYGQSVWSGKPGAVISNSPGNLSAFGANHHLRQSLVFLNVFTMQQPEVYLSNIAQQFDDEGNLNNKNTKDFLQNVVTEFKNWCEKF